ncbi:MAG: hypothetical protein KH230_16910 [Enterocloster asparagiformis]|nr:hypothetical protein [Enterocloster asparagiformis]
MRSARFWRKQFYTAWHDAEFWKSWTVGLALLNLFTTMTIIYLLYFWR